MNNLKKVLAEWYECIPSVKKLKLAFFLFFNLNILGLHGQNAPEVRQFMGSSPTGKSVTQSERDLPIVGQADVVVVGGGVAGVTAAIHAASEGLSVILIESRNYFGQEFTSTNQCRTSEGPIGTKSPLANKMYRELAGNKTTSGDYVDPIALRSYLLGKITDQPQIEVYLYSLANGVVQEGGRVRGVVFSGRAGRQVVLAKAVVDATEDGRIVAAAGGKFSRNMEGTNIARRFIAIDRPEFLPLGPRPVASNLGIGGDSIYVHDKFIELAIVAQVGDDVAGDLSAIHAKTLEKSFALRDHLSTEGISLENFTPSNETWMDKMPIVSTKGRWNGDFSQPDVVLPVGLNGLVVTGRTVNSDASMATVQNLLSIGELSGKTAVSLARAVTGFVTQVKSSPSVQSTSSAMQVHELLEGIEPGMNYNWIKQSAVNLPVKGEYDVLVIGGGTSGAFSAIAAARKGVRVALVEILPNLGGISTNRVNGYYWGVPWKSFLRQEVGDQIQLQKSTGGGPLEKVRFSGEDKKLALQELAINSGVKIFYQSLATGTVTEGKKVRGVVIDNASGRHILMADVVVDATGHAGIAVAAGAKYHKGRETDGFMNEIEHGPMRDPTHLADISTSYLKYPSYAVSMNIRESRRIIGDYIVTFDDVIHERNFPDVVARWRSNYDTHLPTSANQSDLAQDWVGILGLWRKPIIGSIPYRSLLPQGVDNILVAAMAYSTDHDALIGGRMQPDMEHLGEAAGVAAAMASKLKVSPRDVPIKNLQSELISLGVLRDMDVPGVKVKNAPALDVLHRQDYWRAEREKEFPPAKEGQKLSPKEAIKLLGTENALEAMVDLYLAGEKSIPLLKPLLKSENRTVYEEAAVLLGLLGDRTAIPALMQFLQERNTRRFEFKLPEASSRPSLPLYWTSVILLGRLEEKAAVPDMIALLSNPPEDFQTLNRKAYADDMFQSTETCPPPLASFTIVALGRIGDKRAVEHIRPYLSVTKQPEITRENIDFETAWGIRTNAAWALARMGDRSGIPVLIELLTSDQALVRNYSVKLLETITTKKLGHDQEAWKQWWLLNN